MRNDLSTAVNQRITHKLVDREVVYCISHLVAELAKKAEEFPDYTDDLYDAYRGLPNYEDAASGHGWDEVASGFSNADENETSDAETWKELCDEQGIDVYDYESEIFEHWIVSDFLANKLEAKGERVLRDFFGMTIWCRATTGQAISIDGVIGEIAADMEILEGQQNHKYWAE